MAVIAKNTRAFSQISLQKILQPLVLQMYFRLSVYCDISAHHYGCLRDAQVDFHLYTTRPVWLVMLATCNMSLLTQWVQSLKILGFLFAF